MPRSAATAALRSPCRSARGPRMTPPPRAFRGRAPSSATGCAARNSSSARLRTRSACAISASGGCSYTTRGCSGCSARRGKPASCPRTRCSRRAPTAATATAHRSGCSSSAARTASTPCAIFRSICSARCARAFPFRSMSTPTVRRAPAGSSVPTKRPRSCAAARRCISRSATALSPPTAHCRRRRTPRAWRSRPPS